MFPSIYKILKIIIYLLPWYSTCIKEGSEVHLIVILQDTGTLRYVTSDRWLPIALLPVPGVPPPSFTI